MTTRLNSQFRNDLAELKRVLELDSKVVDRSACFIPKSPEGGFVYQGAQSPSGDLGVKQTFTSKRLRIA